MSGSGGGFGTGGSGTSDESCEDLVLETQLSSPKQEVIADLKIGSQLTVRAWTSGATTAIEVLHGRKVAGGLASPRISRLLECIAIGTEYIATVTAKKDGQVKVRVSAK